MRYFQAAKRIINPLLVVIIKVFIRQKSRIPNRFAYNLFLYRQLFQVSLVNTIKNAPNNALSLRYFTRFR
jgi:hypothetical protein